MRQSAMFGLSSRAAHEPRHARRHRFGVAIALALELGNILGDRPFVSDLTALLLAAIAINEVLGPLLMKWGLQRADEIPAPAR